MVNVLQPMNKLAKKHKKIFLLILICLGVLSAIFALQPDSVDIKTTKQSQNIEQEAKILPTPSSVPSFKPKVIKTSAPSPTSIPTTQPTYAPTPSSEPSAQLTSNPSFEVNVSVNGAPSFAVLVNEGANQCDVLTKALEQNKITQLNMRYESNYQSNAVYQINNIGKENSVWWVYKVNGISATKGCSFIKSNKGDSILWEYKGS